ncbi:hypothetical protein N665_1037s0001 [Sinapis alba]|nr:hypothetical protein N665_1037s0001 [Sinapis alba]
MASYIFPKRNGIDIINLTRTARFLSEACDLVFDAATISLIDTNCNPNLLDISIQANGDPITSIRLILNKLVFAICEGHSRNIQNS